MECYLIHETASDDKWCSPPPGLWQRTMGDDTKDSKRTAADESILIVPRFLIIQREMAFNLRGCFSWGVVFTT